MNRIFHYVKKQPRDESSWSSNEIRNNALSLSPFNDIPNEIILYIFRFLSMRDIDKTAPQLFSLLQKASRFQQQWQQSAVLKQMIQRYYRFMQLKESNGENIFLIPTLDIEIVWQTHLLRPQKYEDDCFHLFSRVIDHSLIIIDHVNQPSKQQAFLNTCQLYEQSFGEEYCKNEVLSNSSCVNNEVYSYWDKTYPEFSLTPPNDYENPFSFSEVDIILDGKWLNFFQQFMFNKLEKCLYWTCCLKKSTGRYFEPESFQRLKKSYERFLYIAAKYPFNVENEFVSPTYAIDFIWHSHMQEPLNYKADCHRLVGYIISHDPWPIAKDKAIKKSDNKANQFWKKEFERDINTDHCTASIK